ncbi:MAG: AI-2E family transporter [Gammaproteobacteria bacterium]
MQKLSNHTIYLLSFLVLVFLIYLLAPILTPFLFSALIAYLANPLVVKLDKHGIPHWLSSTIVYILVFGSVLVLFLLLTPLLQKQVKALIEVLPSIINWLEASLLPWIKETIVIENIASLKSSLAANLPKAGIVFTTVLSSGTTVISWLVNIVLIPVVTFYFLRDWQKILASLRHTLPKSLEPTVVKLAKEWDSVLGAFFRGQLLVMMIVGLIYGLGLTIAGLHTGLMIGLIGGLLSIVPYLGSIFVIVTASILAMVQFGVGDELAWVWGVYLIGQFIESYFLTPYLIGDRIGLHPVAVIFAIMTGGALFGFFGILIALPAAASIMVLLRYFNRKYHASGIYKDV